MGRLMMEAAGSEVAFSFNVPDTVPAIERRASNRTDRRRNSRSGRRASDPHTNWRRIAWLFAAYAVYLSVLSLPASVKGVFNRLRNRPVGE